MVLCHYGTKHRPPDGLRPGDVITGDDGQQWAFTGDTSDGRAATFKINEGRTTTTDRPRAPRRSTSKATPAPAPLPAGPITLARLPEPWPAAPPDHLPLGHRITYSATQWAEWEDGTGVDSKGNPKSKGERPRCRDTSGKVHYVAGPDPWPLFGADLLHRATGQWIAAAEGPKCAMWLQAGGLVAVSQPGHDHKPKSIERRFRDLQAAGITGMAYLADHDQAGRKKAAQLAGQAALVGFPLLVLHAVDVWPGTPEAGSIDDAPGTATERVAAIEAALGAAITRQRHQQAQPLVVVVDGTVPVPRKDATKQDLQAFLRQTYSIRFNELQQQVEIEGGAAVEIDLADSFLADQHGIETTKQAARDSFCYIARCNPYNPVATYLEGLRDQPGLRLIPADEMAAAFGVSPGDTLSVELLARHLAGAFRRGMEPGYKYDQMLILLGDQGQGKGEAIKAVHREDWYASTTKVPKSLEDREFLETLNSVWGFEFDECEKVLLGRDSAELKGFCTRSSHNYVQKYETQSRQHPRRSVPWGSTNEQQILNDPTGARRFWLIDVRGGTIRPDWISANRDSIWATVATWVSWGLESWIPPGHITAVAAADRAAEARLSEPWEGAIRAELETLGRGSEGIGQDDLIRSALQGPDLIQINRAVQMTVTRIVTASDFTTHDGTVCWVQAKRRYAGRPPRSGYRPVLVPTAPTCPNQSWGGWDGSTPWNDRALTTLFQPFQPLGKVVVGKGAGAVTGVGAGGSVARFTGNGWRGRNTPETPSGTVDLPRQRGREQVGAGWGQVGSPPLTTPPGPQPFWLSELRRLVAERPHAAAATLALALDPQNTGMPTGRQVKPWLDFIRGEDQQAA